MRLLLVASGCLMPAVAAAAQIDNFDDDDAVVLGLLLLIVLLAVYFLPWIVANHRYHVKQTAIFFLNLFFGWTLIGWLAALVWAVANPSSVLSPIRPRRAPKRRTPFRVALSPAASKPEKTGTAWGLDDRRGLVAASLVSRARQQHGSDGRDGPDEERDIDQRKSPRS